MAQRFFVWMGTAIFLLALVIPAAAQYYPNKPINLVIQYPPGGTTDLTARALANGAKKYLGQPVICENRSALAEGDEIRTELSCKYTRESLARRLQDTGLVLERWTTDADGLFAAALLRRR